MKPTSTFLHWRLKTRLWVGFGLILGLLSLIAGLAVINQRQMVERFGHVAEELQPALISAGSLQQTLLADEAALGFYLLTHEPDFEKRYRKGLEQAANDLATLEQRLGQLGKGEARWHALLGRLREDLQRYTTYRERVITLAEKPGENFPGRQYGASHINPYSQQILQILSGMIQSESDEEPDPVRRQLLLDMEQLRYTFANVMNGVRAYLAFRNGASLNEMEAYRESLRHLMEKLHDQEDHLTLDQLDALDQLNPLMETFFTNLEELKRIHGSEGWRQDAQLIRQEIGPLIQGMVDTAEKIKEQLREETTRASQGVVSQGERAVLISTLIALVGLLCGAGGAWWLQRSTVSPLRELAETMEGIASGDGDLTQRLAVRGKDEIAQVAQAFNRFVTKIHELVGQVAQVARQVGDTGANMEAVARATETGADQAQQETRQAATAMSELQAFASEVANSAEQATEAARSASEASHQGREVIDRNRAAITALAEEVHHAAEVIQRLEDDSEQIGKVLDVIRDIAEQTNLLALNAAIEAARAGEQGRGFAVVADEVRTLAGRTQNSTEEIQQMIERLQGAARAAAQVMTDGRKRTDETVAQAEQAQTALATIDEAIQHINHINTHIAEAAEAQQDVAATVHANVNTINDIAEQTAAGCQQTASNTAELNRLTQTLRGLIDQFKI